MTRFSRFRTGQDGLSLIEVIVACTVLLVGVLGAIVLMDGANAATVKTRAREGGTNLARELVEGARSLPYANITSTSVDSQLQAIDALADESPTAGWQVRRRGFTYTVTAQVCTMDDARDGGGTHAAGGFCADSVAENTPDAGSGSVDRAPEDYKRVRVQASWQQGNTTREVHQTTIVNNPGSAGGPAVRTLTLDGSAAPPPVTSGNSLTFALTTSSRPESLHWLLDGASQGPITSGSNLSWSFDWSIGPAGTGGNPDPNGSAVDGVYIISAEAFDAYEVAGPSRSLTVTLNRSEPDKVEGVAGGRNGSPSDPANQTVELEWLETPERDIIGYAAYRVNSDGTETLVCPMAKVTTCIDPDPPVAPTLEYVVYAFDLDSLGLERRGPVASDRLQVVASNNPPLPPTLLTVSPLADGSTQLTWLKSGPPPLPGDPDGDSIDFYRVYRDGQAVENRYARWDDPNLTVTFIDGATDGVSHCYSITAVDRYYAESLFLGPECG